MSSNSKIVLITGCTEGSLGDALCRAFHNAGHHVIATARTPSKLTNLQALGIKTMALDVTSSSSISSCLSEVQEYTKGNLDILVNNAGTNYCMTIADTCIPEAKKLFDLNVWAVIEMTQAFLPLLIKSKGVIVNHTSVASVLSTPFSSTYCASKAALAAYTDGMRTELKPFDIKVVELKTGAVKSGIYAKMGNEECGGRLPDDSIYAVAREQVLYGLRGGDVASATVDSDVWAKGVVKSVTQKTPERRVWLGGSAYTIWFAKRFLPVDSLNGWLGSIFKMPEIEKLIRAQREK